MTHRIDVSRTPVFYPVFSLRDCVSVCTFVLSQCRLTSVDTRLHDTAVWAGSSPSQEKRVPHVVLCVLDCTRATLMYSTVPLDSLLDMNTRGIPFSYTCPVYRWWSWLLLWTQSSRVHSPVVQADDCRSAGPWFNSGRRSLIHTHWHVQRNNIMSPITTTVTLANHINYKKVS